LSGLVFPGLSRRRREGGKEGRREGGKEGRREGGKEGRREAGWLKSRDPHLG